jgi:hypothetical protein
MAQVGPGIELVKIPFMKPDQHGMALSMTYKQIKVPLVH